MLKIEILRFQPQDIITSSVAGPRCDCDIYGCQSKLEYFHETNIEGPNGGYLTCHGYDNNGSHTCGK